jgi:nitrogen fixation protein FixH
MANEASKNAETRARRRWVAFVVGIFASQAALWVFAIALVASDSSHAIVSDYDRRALDWDENVRRRQSSAALGWSAEISVETRLGHDGHVLAVKLADAQALPISDAEVEVTVFHQAKAAERTTLRLHADGRGGYEAVAPMTRSGKWRLELLARHAGHELVLDRMHAVEPRE